MDVSIFQKDCDYVYSVAEKDSYPKSILPEVAFLGKSNVGKSSLINLLVNRKNLVRVSNQPGSTIKLNYFNLGGKLMMVDLPGYGYAKRSKDLANKLSHLVENYLQRKQNIKKIVFIIDARRGIKKEDHDLLTFFNKLGLNLLLVLNKIDKLSIAESDDLNNFLKERYVKDLLYAENVLNVSCFKKDGIRDLKKQIVYNL
jgi:GTP-binding protein